MDWQALFFDFDGVVLDSTRTKTESFALMYQHEGEEVLRQVLAYHREHGGISRLVKFRHFEETILGREIDQARVDELGRRYSERVVNQVISAPFIPGAEQTLQQIREQGWLAFVVSGTPHEELHRIVAARALGPFFREVHGSPRLKPVIIGDILKRHGLAADRCLFFGDAPTDYRAAKATGLRFCGIEPPGEKHPFPAGTHIRRRLTIPTTAELDGS